jgi:cation/acetate symporter
VAFATILAVVAGLTLAGASAISHDLYAGVIRRGQSLKPKKCASLKCDGCSGRLSRFCWGCCSRSKTWRSLVGLAFAVAASANFPALVLSVFWGKLSTAGAVASIVTGWWWRLS